MSSSLSSSFALSERAIASLFDIFAEDSLRASLKPAWDFVCRFLASKYPTTQLIATLKYSDEIYLVLLLLMEEYNLRRSSASMTEHFYQLKRESTALQSSFVFRNAKMISLLSVVVLPYLLNKLEKHYGRIKERVAVASNTNGLTSMERFIYKWYPVLSSFTKWLRMLNYLLFLFNYTKHAFPLLNMTQMQLKYDIPAFLDAGQKKGVDLTSTKKKLLWSLVSKPFDFLSYGLTKMAPVFFYSLSFLDTFYQDDSWTKSVTSMGAIKMEPPQNSKVMSSIQLPTSKKLCPICHKVHDNPSTLPISGFVFCYSCIHSYVQRYSCCPLTYRPCGVKDIIRIHE